MTSDIIIPIELVYEMIGYIESVEVALEGEFGIGMSLDDLIKCDEMPDLYNKLVKLSKI